MFWTIDVATSRCRAQRCERGSAFQGAEPNRRSRIGEPVFWPGSELGEVVDKGGSELCFGLLFGCQRWGHGAGHRDQQPGGCLSLPKKMTNH